MSESAFEDIVYLYDENAVIGMVYTNSDGTNTYYFHRNLLGDIIGIYDTNGNKVAEYKYDAWGNCTIIKNKRNGENPFLNFYSIKRDRQYRARAFRFLPNRCRGR